jgi:hypothetical protein
LSGILFHDLLEVRLVVCSVSSMSRLFLLSQGLLIASTVNFMILEVALVFCVLNFLTQETKSGAFMLDISDISMVSLARVKMGRKITP